MTVLELMIELRKLPNHMEVRTDRTAEQADFFKFMPVVFVEAVEAPTGEEFVVISHQNLPDDGDKNVAQEVKEWSEKNQSQKPMIVNLLKKQHDADYINWQNNNFLRWQR